jgi:hypothetical protein
MNNLLRLKERIEDLRNGLAQDEGALRQLDEALKEQGFNSFEEAKQGLQTMQQAIKQAEADLWEQTDKIQKMMVDWQD